MANPETQALLETALRHVLAEQAKLPRHRRAALLTGPALELNELAAEIWKLLAEGFHKIRSASPLISKVQSGPELTIDILVRAVSDEGRRPCNSLRRISALDG
jgi:hypothetical protein